MENNKLKEEMMVFEEKAVQYLWPTDLNSFKSQNSDLESALE